MFVKKVIKKILNFVKELFYEVVYYKRYLEFVLFPESFYKYLKIVSVETCSVCNLKCRYCNLDGKGRNRFMDIKIYEKLLDELSSNPRFKIEILEMPLGGEFLLHPEIDKIMELTKYYIEKSATFKPWVILNDNMMMMDQKRIDFILNSSVFNQIICSIDGKDKKSFEYMRKGAVYETVINNTMNLIKTNNEFGKKVLIEINNGYDKSCKDIPMSNEMRDVFERSDLVRYWTPVDFNSSFSSTVPNFSPKKGFCSFVFGSVSISSGGKVIKCCMDLKEETTFGDLTLNSLSDVMISKERRRFLNKMFLGNRSELKGCLNCLIKYPDINNKREL